MDMFNMFYLAGYSPEYALMMDQELDQYVAQQYLSSLPHIPYLLAVSFPPDIVQDIDFRTGWSITFNR